MQGVDFDRTIDRRHTASEKWDKYRGRDIIPMWVADMDFQAPPAVCAALRQRVAHGIFGYTNAPEALVAAVVDRLEARYGWTIDPGWLVWLPGLVSGLNLACRAVGRRGDAVLTTVPVYPPFLSAPGHCGRELVTTRLVGAPDRWRFDFDRLESAVTGRTRLFLLCSPQNPVGRVFTREELEALADICRRHDLVVCSDEIHCELVLDPGKVHIPFAALSPAVADRTITLMAPSKTFNIPGLGCAFAVIPNARLRRRFLAAMAGVVPSVNALGFSAALAAFTGGGPWHAALLAYLRANRDAVARAVEQMPGLTTTHVEATYLTWIDTRGAQLDEPGKFFEAAGVGLSDGRAFGGPGFLRLNFGCPRQTLTTALERMKAALTTVRD